jgi:hypothetical protein
MKKLGIIGLLILLANSLFGQEQPYIQLNIKENIFVQKISFLQESKVLTKQEVQKLMAQSNPETMDLYLRSMSQNKLSSTFSIASLAATIGTFVYVLSPHQTSSTGSSFIWPLVITDLSLSILSGVFKRNAKNLSQEAVDSYNFGRTDQPVYFEENRIDQPLFSYVIQF